MSTSAPPPSDSRPLLLYDGKCRLCDGFVAFLIKRDPAKHLRFCALQSPQAQPFLDAAGIDAEDAQRSFVLVQADGSVLRCSDAALAVAAQLAWPWPWLAAAGVWIPRLVRDAIYGCVSRNRHHLGHIGADGSASCLAPTANVLSRMLDADEIRAELKRDAAAERARRKAE